MYEDLLALPNVVGAGIGFKNGGNDICTTVLVSKKLPTAALRYKELIPRIYYGGGSGLATDVIQVGDIVAQEFDPKQRIRPAMPGVSIGHYKVSAGTFGAVVRDLETGYMRILSNNHVMANSNDAKQGDSIFQPGTYDGGKAIDVIAFLDRWVPISMGFDSSNCDIAMGVAGLANFFAKILRRSHRLVPVKTQALTNKVDAAIAMPLEEEQIDPVIIRIGKVKGRKNAVLGDAVQKYGRTTAYTTGKIQVVDATVNVNYGDGKMALFSGQYITGPMSAPGDSGSLVLDMENNAVGLLFAGSTGEDGVMIFNPIQDVLEELNIEMWVE